MRGCKPLIGLSDLKVISISRKLLIFSMFISVCIPLFLFSQSVAWINRYNNPGNGVDIPHALTVDLDGNIYVTGESYGLSTDYDFATVKYSLDGTEQWVRRYNGPANGYDAARAIAVDHSGNVYVTGISQRKQTFNDYVTIKYDAEGNELWVRRYDGSQRSFDEACAMAVDSRGCVYVTGRSIGIGTGYDYATIKYSPSGEELWVARYSGAENLNDEAQAVAVDSRGNVYVTGKSETADDGVTNWDYVTVKYGRTGSERWVRRYSGPSGWDDVANAIIVDRSGNIYVTGTSWDYADYATIKYSAAGDYQWMSRYRGPHADYSSANAMTIDEDGNLYVSGCSGASNNLDYLTIKYNPQGRILWVASYDGPEGLNDAAIAVSVDKENNVYVTGTSQGRNTGEDFVTIKYNSDGIEEWVGRYNGPANDQDRPSALAIDGDGNIYVTGSSYSSCTNLDYLTIKYKQDVNLSALDGEEKSKIGSGYDQCSLEVTSASKSCIKIRYSLKNKTYITLLIHDVAGRVVKKLTEGKKDAGSYTEIWNGIDDGNSRAPSGIYFIHLKGKDDSRREKVVFLR